MLHTDQAGLRMSFYTWENVLFFCANKCTARTILSCNINDDDDDHASSEDETWTLCHKLWTRFSSGPSRFERFSYMNIKFWIVRSMLLSVKLKIHLTRWKLHQRSTLLHLPSFHSGTICHKIHNHSHHIAFSF